MSPRSTLGRAPFLVASLVFLSACADRLPSGSGPGGPSATVPAGEPLPLLVRCEVRLAQERMRCGTVPPATVPGQPAAAIVYGGLDQYVSLPSYDIQTDTAAGFTTMEVAVTNLIPQPIGTADEVTVDPAGIQVFFVSEPMAISGSGTVWVGNADGVGDFTATDQPFFRYVEMLQPSQTSATRTWLFTHSPAVQAFTFDVMISTEVPYPDGWVEVEPPAVQMGIGDTVSLAATIRDALGEVSDGPTITFGPGPSGTITGELNTGANLTWSSSDDAVVSVNEAGRVTGVDEGTAVVRASTPTRPSRADVPVVIALQRHFLVTGAGRYHTCGISDVGRAYCWGRNANGQLGDSTVTQRLAPVAVKQPATVTFTRLSLGNLHTCALAPAGQAWCWGFNTDGRLGNGNTTQQNAPAAVQQPAGVTFTEISVGGNHTCALTAAGQAYCWGQNQSGQLGNNSTLSRTTPVAVQQPAGVTFARLSAGDAHTCALTSGGQAYCWGFNLYGQVGDASTTARRVPTAVQQPVGVTFLSLAGGYTHTCALTAAGQAYCWGRNNAGQLGDNSTLDRSTPGAVQQGGFTYITLSTGGSHTCALTSGGLGFCWGGDASGALGNGAGGASLTPTAVAQPAGALLEAITADELQSCAMRNGGRIYCWGANTYGQLGDRSTSTRPAPVPVHH